MDTQPRRRAKPSKHGYRAQVTGLSSLGPVRGRAQEDIAVRMIIRRSESEIDRKLSDDKNVHGPCSDVGTDSHRSIHFPCLRSKSTLASKETAWKREGIPKPLRSSKHWASAKLSSARDEDLYVCGERASRLEQR